MGKEKAKWPVTTQDRMNHFLGLVSADQQINMVLEFGDLLDREWLEKSIRESLRLFPVLGCRFVPDEVPFWEEREDAGGGLLEVGEFGEEEEAENAVTAFLTRPGDRLSGPMLTAALIRSGSRDRLVLKVSHMASDAAGLREYAAALSGIYSCFSRLEAPSLTPGGFRDQAPVFAAAGVEDIRTVIRQDPGTASLWGFPSDPEGNRCPALAVRSLEEDRLKTLRAKVKAAGATINDALLAAYFRALALQAVYAEPRTKARPLSTTVDLRRYLPEGTTGTVCNLSSMETVVIEPEEGDTFGETLAKVHESMASIKNQLPGLSTAALIEMLAKLSLSEGAERIGAQGEMARKQRMALPILTNFGMISKEPLQFGNAKAEDGWMTGPIMQAPFFSVAVSTYRSLTLTVGFHTPAVSRDSVDRLLDRMLTELTEW